MTVTYKKIISWVIVGGAFTAIVFFIFSYFSNGKTLKVLLPAGNQVLMASKVYQIRWEAKNIDRVGILLVKGKDSEETKWIARNIPARERKYDWEIFIWEKTGEDYRIAVLEYPWQEGKVSAHSDFFSIIGPEFASCDQISIEKEWPYLPSDYPGLRRVFVTSASFTGNLGGLSGADQVCQEEAEAKNFKGTWKAWLGDDLTFAVDRLELDGIFILAESAGLAIEDRTCHRLLGKNFEKVFKDGSGSLALETEKLERGFLTNLASLWLGRISKESKKDCLFIVAERPLADLARHYSFTTTCQNWSTAREVVPGYPPSPDEEREFSVCYTPEGLRTKAVALAGMASGLTGKEVFNLSLAKTCNIRQKLLCIEQ